MILRRWRGAVRAADAEAYLRHQDETGVRDYRATDGNLGALVLSRQRDDDLLAEKDLHVDHFDVAGVDLDARLLAPPDRAGGAGS